MDFNFSAVLTPMHEIEPGLYLGNYQSANDISKLQ